MATIKDGFPPKASFRRPVHHPRSPLGPSLNQASLHGDCSQGHRKKEHSEKINEEWKRESEVVIKVKTARFYF